MRTRFLATDYFSSPSPIDALRRLEFRALSPPDLAFLDPTTDEIEIAFSGISSSVDLPLEIDSLPFQTGLEQFLYDVVPRLLPTEEGDPVLAVCEESGLVSGAKGIDNPEGFQELINENEVEKLLHLDMYPSTTEAHLKENVLAKEIVFEVVEVESPLIKLVNSFQYEEGGIHFDIPDIKILVEPIVIEDGLTISYTDKVAKYICSIENICANLDDDKEYSFAKDGHSSNDRAGNAMILPHFEVNEDNLETDIPISHIEAFDNLIPVAGCWHETQVDELVVDALELLGSNSIDILEHFAGGGPAKHSPDESTFSLDNVLEMNHIKLSDNLLFQRGSSIHQITADGICSHLPCYIDLQEIQIFEIPSDDVLQTLVCSQAAVMPSMPNQMFTDVMDLANNLYEYVVSSDLTLVDDTFQSLPTPVFSNDDYAIKSVSTAFGAVVSTLRPHPSSACDAIYLDWHLLLEGPCDREICSTYTSLMGKVNCYDMSYEVQIDYEGDVPININFFDDIQERKGFLPSKLLPSELLGSISHELHPSANDGTYQLKDQTRNTNNVEQKPNIISDKSSVFFESMSQHNDLNFFLDARKGKIIKNFQNQTIRYTDKKIRPSIFPSEGPSLPSLETKWIMEIHRVRLSSQILGMMEQINCICFSISEECKNLRKINLAPIGSNAEFLHLPRKKLRELISRNNTSQDIEDSDYGGLMDLVALYAVKQLGYLLCSFGFQTARQYVIHLTRTVVKVAEKLRNLEALMEDFCQKSDKQVIESHPSLSHIESILTSNIGITEKVLIVADRNFWLPLTQKLSAMGISFIMLKIDGSTESNLDLVDGAKYKKISKELHFDCSITSYENILHSFPIKNFNIILEYGGANASSRISSLLSESDYLSQLHFIHVDIGSVDLPIFLSKDFNASECPESARENSNSGHIVDILNFVPTEEKSSTRLSESAEPMNTPYPEQVMNADKRTTPFPDIVIIVNTKSFEKKMLVSRRTSYQKILAMEKRGLQVVERDIGLPLDLVFSAEVCLIWYEASNFGSNKQSRIGSSDITISIENIATDILMALSFSFSCCIMIFEGESSFLVTIMESSDCLYAAAASLDMNLQLFFSHAPESTDEIILSSIQNATKSSRSLYPAMPESESLGESFLTTFPSLNPLSAHAILSSVGTLMEFLEWSNERRIQAIGNYRVRDESVSLFSSLCRYGELGESKSVMTDCSSIDSEIHSNFLPSPMKKQRYQVLPDNDIDSFFDETNNQRMRMDNKPQPFRPNQLLNFSNICEKLKNLEKSNSEDVILKRPRGTLGEQKRSSRVMHDYGDFTGNVDSYSCMFLSEQLSPESDSLGFSMMPELRSAPVIVNSDPMSQEPHSKKSYCITNSAETNHDKSRWSFLKDVHQASKDDITKQTTTLARSNDALTKHNEYLRSSSMQDQKTKVLNSSDYGRKLKVQGEKTSSDSARKRQGSWWTTKLLHRTNENSSSFQQKYPSNTKNYTRTSDNKDCKILSPSIIDSLRYDDNSKVKRTAKRKRANNGNEQLSSNSKAKKEASSIVRTWTPVDKRARQDLSFTRDGIGNQSRLVWRNRNSPHPVSSIKKRYRDEG